VRRAPELKGIKVIPFSSFAHVGLAGQAEGERFELSSDLTARNGFRDRPADA
jgi:hypothetical protein